MVEHSSFGNSERKTLLPQLTATIRWQQRLLFGVSILVWFLRHIFNLRFQVQCISPSDRAQTAKPDTQNANCLIRSATQHPGTSGHENKRSREAENKPASAVPLRFLTIERAWPQWCPCALQTSQIGSENNPTNKPIDQHHDKEVNEKPIWLVDNLWTQDEQEWLSDNQSSKQDSKYPCLLLEEPLLRIGIWNNEWPRPRSAAIEKSLAGGGSLKRLFGEVCEVAHTSLIS